MTSTPSDNEWEMADMKDDRTLFDRLLAVQMELEVVSKGMTNPVFESKYANINDILEIVLPALNKHGVLLLQPLTHVDGKPAIKTILMHGTERIEEVMVLHADPNPQKMGSAYTYGRRHAVISAVGVRTADDDDGALASGTQSSAAKKGQPKAQPTEEAKEIPTCDICGESMHPQTNNPGKWFCKHSEGETVKWGKPIFSS